MKKFIAFAFLMGFSIFILILSYNGTPDNSYAILNVGEKTPIATPCYICQGGGYVCYSGSDTFDKRKKAKKEHKCNVKGTSTCSSINCNGKYVINQ